MTSCIAGSKADAFPITVISSSHRRTAAFTLIELLVVIGIIALLAGVIGLALRGGNPGTALQAGQSTLVSLLANARGQAALNQTRAMLIVDVNDSTNDNYLRAFQVVIESTANPGKWIKTGDIVKLPQGIYVVPKTTSSLAAVTMSNWPTNKRLSTAIQAPGTAGTVTWDATVTAADANLYLQFNTVSQFGTMTGGKIVLAAGQRTNASTITLSNPDAIRGVVLSNYGVATVVNDGASFD